MEQMGLHDHIDEMYAEAGDAKLLMTIGLDNAIKAAFAQMEANNELDYALDVFNWIAQAHQLGIHEASPMFDAAGVVYESRSSWRSCTLPRRRTRSAAPQTANGVSPLHWLHL